MSLSALFMLMVCQYQWVSELTEVVDPSQLQSQTSSCYFTHRFLSLKWMLMCQCHLYPKMTPHWRSFHLSTWAPCVEGSSIIGCGRIQNLQ
ncbi:hypothetical protein EDD16DRAFT_297570 [Pisolithus croceorrhizus]|nr:hypothetical protein EDD16DRAFT_297570 [Pisolithus croceorrhizus]